MTMAYTDLRKAYPWMTSKYVQTANIPYKDFDKDILGKTTTLTYDLQDGRWMLLRADRADLTARYYFNSIDAVPLFRRLDGFERVECSYTPWGRIPTKVTSISPDKRRKVVREFHF